MNLICRKCKEEKHFSCFHKKQSSSTGFSTSCKQCEKKRGKKYRQNNREKDLLKHARRRAKEKSLPFNIEIADLEIPEVCPVLHIPIFSGNGASCDNSPNVDRIFPDLGYVKGNVRVISAKANRIKSDATVEELRCVLKDLQKQELLLERGKK